MNGTSSKPDTEQGETMFYRIDFLLEVPADTPQLSVSHMACDIVIAAEKLNGFVAGGIRPCNEDGEPIPAAEVWDGT